MLGFTFLVLMAVSATLAKNQYCQLCKDHTMCVAPEISERCRRGEFAQGVDAEQQRVVVHQHNLLRSKVALGQERRGAPGPQPSASDMKKLVWEPELARIAQRWANQCHFEHDACRKTARFSVGQNLYMSSKQPCEVNNSQDWPAAITALYDEVADFSKNDINRFKFSSGTGHYTQIVWGNTETVGCGFSSFQDGAWCRKLYVCNYGPSGNYIGSPMYKVGSPRESCSNSPSDPKYPGLC